MKTKQESINLYYTNNVTSYKGIKWTDIFNSEQELMDIMYKMKDTRFSENKWVQMLVRYTDNGWELSEKQLKQLKRNAWIVAKLANDNHPNDEHIFC